VHHALLIFRNILERNPRSLGERLRRVVGSERRPVMVGAQIDVLADVLFQCGIRVYSGGIFQQAVNVVDVILLAAAVRLDRLRAVELA